MAVRRAVAKKSTGSKRGLNGAAAAGGGGGGGASGGGGGGGTLAANVSLLMAAEAAPRAVRRKTSSPEEDAQATKEEQKPGSVVLAVPPPREIPRPVIRSNRTFGLDGRLRIVQLTDLHIMDIDRAFGGTTVPEEWRASTGDSEACLDRTLELIREIVSSQSVDVAVLTGDIVDARAVSTLDEFLRAFRPLACTLLELRVPWIFLPGNHEDGHGESYARHELTKLLCLPGSLCRPGSIKSFDQTHALPIAPDSDEDEGVVGTHSALLQLVDARWTETTCYITEAQVADARSSLKTALGHCAGRVMAKIAFAHEPFDEFRDATIPIVSGCCSHPAKQRMEDSGYLAFLREQGFHGLFVGHDHQNDFVRWGGGREPWLGHGRCGSYFPPSTWEGKYPMPFGRGARLFEVDVRTSVLSTWIYEAQRGTLEASRLRRPI